VNRKRKWLGFSLAEACIALALLTAVIIFSATIYQTTLNAGKKLEGRLDAAYEARRQLVAISHWLKEPANFQAYGDYSPEIPAGVEVEVSVVPFETASPNRTFEDSLAEPRSMLRSYLQVTVTVTRDRDSTQLTSIVGAPVRELLTIEPILLDPKISATTLSIDETIEFSASLRDKDGLEIEDAFFLWSVRPITGVATLESVSRDGRRATFKNISYKRDGSPIYTGGTCLVGVGTTYAGEEIWTTPTELRLTPP
jgi:hypothetical protein